MAQLRLEIVQGSILDVDADVIVNAANSFGIMGGGVAGVIKRAAGQVVEDEAKKLAPIAVGQALLTSGGRTKFKGIIHAPTMSEPGMRIPADNVALATRAALGLADEHGFTSIAFPGMGTGVGGVAARDAAIRMVKAVREFVPRTLNVVTLVDIDPDMVGAWNEARMAYGL
jgi:O-acetyl-ADP-ribose deacetylase (regulator of RNase III)